MFAMWCVQEEKRQAEADQAAQKAFLKSPLASLRNLYGLKVRAHLNIFARVCSRLCLGPTLLTISINYFTYWVSQV